MTELKQKAQDELTNNATAIAGLGITQTHLTYIKKAAKIPKGHKFPLHLLTDYLEEHPDAMASGIAKRMASGQHLIAKQEVVTSRIGHSKKHRASRNPKIKIGVRESTPDRISCTYRLKADTYHAIQKISELTKQSATKIIENIVNEFHEVYLEKNEENKLQSARLAAQQAKEAYDTAQAKIAKYEQENA
jgi:hypothetical protein